MLFARHWVSTKMIKADYHIHTALCDGKSTPEEVVLSALEKGFLAIGFSAHGYTDFDLSFCVRDLDGYINEITRLKEKYKKDIEIYLGVEEDITGPAERNRYDYIISSSHYSVLNGKYYSIDESAQTLKETIKMWNNNAVAMARNYYETFCDYILSKKPDIIGHFDLITKFDEKIDPIFLGNIEYEKIAHEAVKKVVNAGSIFEVNTGAVSRGYRTTPYPSTSLLYTIKQNGGKIILNSDSHMASNLGFDFEETKAILKDIGFKSLCVLYHNEFLEQPI